MSIRFTRQRAAWLLLAAPAWASACDPPREAAREANTSAIEERERGQAGSQTVARPATAQEHAPFGAALPGKPAAQPHHQPQPQPQAQDTVAAGFGRAATMSNLEQTRGGDGGIASDTTLGGTVSGNSATNVVTGANSIQASSFAGATGIPIVIQNTGANVLIQNATVINLQLK